MRIQYCSFYRATGAEIPAELLQCEIAFISDKHPNIVAFPTFRGKYGILRGGPTMKRWQSVGITLAHQITQNRLYHYVDINNWYTYRYPRRDIENFRQPQPELVKVPMSYFRRYEVFSSIDPVDMEKN